MCKNLNNVPFLCNKLFQKRGHYSRGDIIFRKYSIFHVETLFCWWWLWLNLVWADKIRAHYQRLFWKWVNLKLTLIWKYTGFGFSAHKALRFLLFSDVNAKLPHEIKGQKSTLGICINSAPSNSSIEFTLHSKYLYRII